MPDPSSADLIHRRSQELAREAMALNELVAIGEGSSATVEMQRIGREFAFLRSLAKQMLAEAEQARESLGIMAGLLNEPILTRPAEPLT